jgi:hypothetical protein
MGALHILEDCPPAAAGYLDPSFRDPEELVPFEKTRERCRRGELEVEGAPMARSAWLRGAGTVHDEGPDQEGIAGSEVEGAGVLQSL